MLFRSLAFTLLATVVPLAAYGQTFQIGGPGAGYSPKYPMLFSKAVRDELKVTEEQNKKIQAKIKEHTPEGSMIRMPAEGKTGEESGPKVMMSFSFKSADGAPPVGGIALDPSKMGTLPGMPDFKKIDEEVNKILEQPQRDRLRQIQLQRVGLTSLGQDDVAKEVELEAEQKEMVIHILDDQRKKTQEHFQKMLADGGGIQQDQVASFMKKLREQTESDLAVILTPEQQTKWEQIKGPKFDKK
jgi:hypothetical protein